VTVGPRLLRASAFFMPLFTQPRRMVFSEVQIQDAACICPIEHPVLALGPTCTNTSTIIGSMAA
jgi:hypothetical protein